MKPRGSNRMALAGPRMPDIYSATYRQDIDNDSSTDEECIADDDDMSSSSSDSDVDQFRSRFGNLATKTDQQGKVRLSKTSSSAKKEPQSHQAEEDEMELQVNKNEEAEESEDEFEAEMERELNQRMFQAEKDASIANPDSEPPPSIEAPSQETSSPTDSKDCLPGTSSKNKAGPSGSQQENDQEKYDDIYFDSDEEEDSGKNSRKVMTNDGLFYDPNMDDEDESWVDDFRRSYQVNQGSAKKKDGSLKPLPNSGAVLNCPACFTVVCLDCQRHEVCKTQYRAMFVMNCSVITTEKLRVPLKPKNAKSKKQMKVVTNPQDEFHPVRCDQCQTEIAMYDQDEIYHFFNVVASHTYP